MSDEVLAILGQKHALRVMLYLRAHGPARFGELENGLALNPAQVDRALKALAAGVWVLAETAPSTRGRIGVRYALSRRGLAFLRAFDGFLQAAERQRPLLGDAAVDELERLLA